MLRSRKITLSVMSAVVLVLSIMVSDCLADIRDWNGPANGDWYTANYWLPSAPGAPLETDILNVLSGSPQTTSDVYTDEDGSITVDGSSASASFGNLFVGYDGSAEMYVYDGGTVGNNHGHIARLSGSIGEVTVDGNGSTWTNSGNLSVGHDGDGTLNITDGGEVSNIYGFISYCSVSTSEVTVEGNGSGSTWTRVVLESSFVLGASESATDKDGEAGIVSYADTAGRRQGRS